MQAPEVLWCMTHPVRRFFCAIAVDINCRSPEAADYHYSELLGTGMCQGRVTHHLNPDNRHVQRAGKREEEGGNA